MADQRALGDQSAPYNIDLGTEDSGLSLDNRVFWDDLYMESISYAGPTPVSSALRGRINSQFRLSVKIKSLRLGTDDYQ